MKNLVQKIALKAEIPEEKAREILVVISDQVKEDFPLLSSVMELMFGDKNFQKKKSIIIDLPENQFIYN
jgi:hypothetical protein